jgi:dipeptidyl aminopeptidase/acylaminoacyl peptidase
MENYTKNPIIPSFDWDGNTLVVLNSAVRYEFGSLYAYNTETNHAEKLDPMLTSCCYTEARFSPDGSYMFFAYQNINDGADAKTKLYYVPYGTIGTGTTYVPFTLPDGLLSKSSNHLDVALRAVK